MINTIILNKSSLKCNKETVDKIVKTTTIQI